MKTNVQLKGLLMLCVVMGIIILSVNFQHSKIGTILLIASVVLLLVAAYYIGNNTNDKQFKRIMKKVGKDNLLYIVDGTAAVDIDSLIIYYGLKRKKYDRIYETNNNIFINVSCALPANISAEEGFHCIKTDLEKAFKTIDNKSIAYKYKTYSFEIHFELQPKNVSAPVLQQIQQSLVSILIDKYHLNSVKRHLKTDENGAVYYWEFVGDHAVRLACYRADDNVWDYDNEDVSCSLSDIKSKATAITEKEFESIYNHVENTQTTE